MEKEVPQAVFQVMDRIRSSAPKTGITQVIVKLGVVNDRDRETLKKEQFEYAWKLPVGGYAITIWAEDVRVQSGTGRWFQVNSLDTLHRRGGGLRSERQQARAERRVQFLREAYEKHSICVGLLQINELSIEQLEQNENASIHWRVKDSDHWHVANWDEERQRAILVRGPRGWVPSLEDIVGMQPAKPADEPEVLPVDPRDQIKLRFPDQEHRDRVEDSAMAKVTQEYESQGFTVQDVSPDNLGYDLEVRDGTGNPVFHVEVKGTSSETPGFFLTRNEFKRSRAMDSWRLAIVTSALSQPRMQVLTVQEMEDGYGFEPLAWRCDLKMA